MPTSPAAARMPSIRSDTPASASIAIHTATKMIVDPKSGWRISRKATAAGQQRRQREHRQRLVRLPQRQQPGHRHDEERLQELGRLELAEADPDPALRAVDLRPDQRNEDHQHEKERRADQRQPPRLVARQHRNADHHRNAEPRSTPVGDRNNAVRRRSRCRPNSAAPRPARRRRPRSARSRSAR